MEQFYGVKIKGALFGAVWNDPDDASECARLLEKGGVPDVTWGPVGAMHDAEARAWTDVRNNESRERARVFLGTSADN